VAVAQPNPPRRRWLRNVLAGCLVVAVVIMLTLVAMQQ
jgi:hypothetical protein